MALAVIQGAGNDRHATVRLKADAAHFVARRSGHFKILADAAAAQLAALRTLPLAHREAVPISDDQRLLQDGWEVAAVIHGAGGGGVGHRVRLDMVAATNFHW